MNLKVGDCIERSDEALELVCQILEVRTTGYTWRYLRRNELPVSESLSVRGRYRSETTTDPFFEQGWSCIDVGNPFLPGAESSGDVPKDWMRRRW
jgi:hypothetical protein